MSSKRPTPAEVVRDPRAHWEFITSADDDLLEGQAFDRKEAGRVDPDASAVLKPELRRLKKHVTATVSAFANSNRHGGLLILGVGKTGDVRGTKHLNEEQVNQLTNVDELLVGQSARVEVVPCSNHEGEDDELILIFVPHSERSLCQTPGRRGKAWMRRAAQNVEMSDDQREQLRIEKQIVSFERTACVPYSVDAVETGILAEFRRGSATGITSLSDEELLYQSGALTRFRGEYWFTNAGLLFFSANPQQVFPKSVVRLLRFEADVSDDDRGLPTYEQSFDGPLTTQIRNFRTFRDASGFFKTYQRRRSQGGFIEEPEFPPEALDEAVVNAIAHRDYAQGLSIEVESYRDAVVVRNPGRLIQRDEDPPAEFSLEEVTLVSMARNQLLTEWLRRMRDPSGALFIRELGEGTRAMLRTMSALKLPPPAFRVSSTQTVLTLANNAVERESAMRAAEAVSTAERFANLFPLVGDDHEGSARHRPLDRNQRREFLAVLGKLLGRQGWFVDRYAFGSLDLHRQGHEAQIPAPVRQILRIYPGYVLQVREHFGRQYLCVDFRAQVKNVRNLSHLWGELGSDVGNRAATVKWEGWQRGRILRADGEWATIRLFDFDTEVEVAATDVIPDLPIGALKVLLTRHGLEFDLSRAIRAASLSDKPAASRVRAERTQAFVRSAIDSLGAVPIDGRMVSIAPTPVSIEGTGAESFELRYLKEPVVEFRDQFASEDIRAGITSFGAYQGDRRQVELVPVCIPEYRDGMRTLIERLKAGAYKYRGSERTFGLRFNYNSIVTPETVDEVEPEIKRLLQEHPTWVGNEGLDRLLLVHTPESGYALDDESSPYYRVKRLLLEMGVPNQMVDTPTLINADWKDLNLALNIAAKCGIVPWVLPDSIPNADYFIGLSYTSSKRGRGQRLMAYANVFNSYGRWEFYSGSGDAFDYDDRTERFERLVEETLLRVESQLSQTAAVHFHYSAKFSKEDRAAMLRAARRVRPRGSFHFVWINSHHNVRLYDLSPDTDGSVRRGGYVKGARNQVYLSTTGSNPFAKVLGTPNMLELNAWVEGPTDSRSGAPDLRALATEVLSLTKLNWASTGSISAEPITTKYAGDIAYLAAAFLRQGEPLNLHPVLERTPWFI